MNPRMHKTTRGLSTDSAKSINTIGQVEKSRLNNHPRGVRNSVARVILARLARELIQIVTPFFDLGNLRP